MDFKTALDLARTWLEDCDRDHLEGYVVIFNGVVAGWKRELDNPQGWEPGCLAVSPEGEVFQAVGGNDYDGAQAWQPLWETLSKTELAKKPSRAALRLLMQAPDRSSLQEGSHAINRCVAVGISGESAQLDATTSHGNAPNERIMQ